MSDREKMSIGTDDIATLDVGDPTAAQARKGPVVYMLRHQAAGILTSHVFGAKPTDAQLAPLIAECERLHGKGHPKTKEPYWSSVVEVPLLEGKELPAFPRRAPPGGNGKKNAAGSAEFSVTGHGTVTPPGR